MIITIGGAPGSGKSTAAKSLAKHFNLKHYSTGDFMREMAKERGLNILEFAKETQFDPSLDKALDQRQEELGKQEDDFIIDSRLGWYFIPKSIKIYLIIDKEVSVKRIFERKRSSEVYSTLEDTKKQIEERQRVELDRYKKYYNLDYTDLDHYDIVFDTTNESVESTAEKLIKEVEKLQ